MAKSYTWKRSKKRVQCARGSLRTKEVGRGKNRRVLRICCPRGQWAPRAERCKVGTRLYEVGTPK